MFEKPLAERTILVLEDEFLIAADIEQICLEAGARKVLLIGDLADLEDGAAFDAAILDLSLGGGSTVDFAARLVAMDVPFIFTTGMPDLGALAADFPGVPLVAKPMTGPDLVEALLVAVNRPSQSAGTDR